MSIFNYLNPPPRPLSKINIYMLTTSKKTKKRKKTKDYMLMKIMTDTKKKKSRMYQKRGKKGAQARLDFVRKRPLRSVITPTVAYRRKTWEKKEEGEKRHMNE